MKVLLSTVALLLAFGAYAYSQFFTPEQIAEWKAAAENGDAEAQYNLGWAYDFAKGFPEGDKEAVKWFRKAAEQGHALIRINREIIPLGAQKIPLGVAFILI
tara:strand:+ start:594 stop:899 length:306 start_codon:yes stop_codon:yes gene_type:complete